MAAGAGSAPKAWVPGKLGETVVAGRAFPTVSLAFVPTPLHPLPRLSRTLGIDVWIKRDDLTGLAFGGNKARKLEFLLGRALAAGADTVLTVGAAQSNHARMTAAAAALLGMECHLVLGGGEPPEPSGNLTLDVLSGAICHFPGTDLWDALEAYMHELAARLQEKGRKPYAMPVGGSLPVGVLGFVRAFDELMAQAGSLGIHPSAIVVASSSGGTQAGLEVGRRLWFAQAERGRRAVGEGRLTDELPVIIGVGVAKTREELRQHIAALATETARMLGSPVVVSPEEVEVTMAYMGPRYGAPTESCVDAIRRLAAEEGIFLDPVYSGKAMAGLLDMAGRGRFPDGSTVIFWHTGGNVALFADEYAALWRGSGLGREKAG